MPRKNEFKLDVISVRLVKDAPLLSEHRIISPRDAVDVIGKELCEMDREVLCVMNLKTDGTPINCHFASVGALNQTIAHPRELFKSSILSNAANIIMIHSHPSGSLQPSIEDTMITDRMVQVCHLIGIPLLDHVIVAGDNSMYFSYKERGILPNPYRSYQTDYRSLDLEAPMVAEKGKKR